MNQPLRNATAAHLAATATEARRQFIDIIATGPRFLAGNGGRVDVDPSTAATVPTKRAHSQLAGRAGVPTVYNDRIRASHPDLWVHTMSELYPKTPTLFRLIDRDGAVTMRAALSDRYQIIDNVDVLTAMLQAFIDSGLGANEVEIDGDFDADDGLLRIRCVVPSVGIAARELVARYRSPFDSRTGQELPMIWAGIEVSNSETGNGALSIAPRSVLQVCRNGMTRTVDGEAFRRVHLGAKLETSGVISWSEATRAKQLELVASAARDAITTFVSPEFLRRCVDEASAAAGIEVTNPDATMARVVKSAQLTDDEANTVLSNWIRSGDSTVLGIAHAVTATAQRIESSDRQAELEREFWNIVNQAEALA